MWCEKVSDAWIGAGFASTPRPDIARWKRRKLLMNLGNAVQALLGLDGGGKRLRELRDAPRERPASPPPGWTWRPWPRTRRQPGGADGDRADPGIERGGGSSWQSLARGTGSIEADYLNGEVCLLGRMHGVPTPVNDLLRRRANAAAAAGLAPGSTTESRNCWPSSTKLLQWWTLTRAYDRRMATLVLTVIGDDRAGLVNAVAQVVAGHGGNWERSQMAELAGKFAGIVLVTVPDNGVDELVAALEPLPGMLDIMAQPGSPGSTWSRQGHSASCST